MKRAEEANAYYTKQPEKMHVYDASESVKNMPIKKTEESHKKCTPGEFGMHKEGKQFLHRKTHMNAFQFGFKMAHYLLPQLSAQKIAVDDMSIKDQMNSLEMQYGTNAIYGPKGSGTNNNPSTPYGGLNILQNVQHPVPGWNMAANAQGQPTLLRDSVMGRNLPGAEPYNLNPTNAVSPGMSGALKKPFSVPGPAGMGGAQQGLPANARMLPKQPMKMPPR